MSILVRSILAWSFAEFQIDGSRPSEPWLFCASRRPHRAPPPLDYSISCHCIVYHSSYYIILCHIIVCHIIIYIYTHIYIYICTPTYIYIYIHTHIHTYIHKHIISHHIIPHSESRLTLVELGWHYLSNATCLIRPHVFYVFFVVSRIAIIC